VPVGARVTESVRFGKRLREVRVEAGLKQGHVARAVDVDSKHISRLERGKVNPSFELIFQLADALRVSPATLFDFDRSETNSKTVEKDLRLLLEKRDLKQLKQARLVLKALFEP
jgi:transcriptional regulator with XRE-family HTH domain